jgi:ribokinase
VQVPAHALKAVDTLGAGDAFAAAFLHAHLAGRAPPDALAFANAAGALATQSFGAQSGMPGAGAVDRMLAAGEQRRA